MKNLVVLALLLMTACSLELRVYTDSDPAYDIANLLTFDWLDKTNIEQGRNPVYYNELNDKRIKEAIKNELASRGYVYKETDTEMVIHYHIMVDDKEAAIPEHEVSTYGPYWQQTPPYVFSYKEGTLIVDIMDNQNNLVWRGSATAPVDDVYTPERTTKLVNKAIRKMFAQFPASKRKQIPFTTK